MTGPGPDPAWALAHPGIAPVPASHASAPRAPLALARPAGAPPAPATPASAPALQRIVAEPAAGSGANLATSAAGSGAAPALTATPSGLPSIAATPIVQRVDGSPPQAPVEPAGRSERELEELARALYGRIQTRLRTEVIHEREARGLGFDAF